MSREEMYRLLEEKHKQTNWDNLESIRAYNEYARQLRSQLEWEAK